MFRSADARKLYCYFRENQMRKSNDNINHKKECGNCLNQLKIVFLRASIKEDVLTFLIPGFILDHIFDPKKDKLSYPVYVSRRGIYNPIPVLKNDNHKRKPVCFPKFL